jgi:bifunctional DNA-binding transcriptional regulator/antitoxin component of YhaV-PrlF toxin-antitoxin module
MQSVKISSKNQIVIPAKYLKFMGLRHGARMIAYMVDESRIMLSKQPVDYIESMRGLGKEVWKKLGGTDKYLKGERDSWGNR